MVDHSAMRLGKREWKHDPRTLMLASFAGPKGLPAPPAAFDISGQIQKWPMMANDRLGDCTCAAAGHMVQQWNAEADHPFIPTDDDVIALYSLVSGYDPKTGANDNGAYEVELLNAWRKTGLAGHKIVGFAGLEPSAIDQVKTAIYMFGNCLLGLALPITAQSQDVWSTVSTTGNGKPGSWGGHAVPLIAYDAAGATCITWGGRKRMTWNFLQTYCDEAYAILATDWMKAASLATPGSFDFQGLEVALNQLGVFTG